MPTSLCGTLALQNLFYISDLLPSLPLAKEVTHAVQVEGQRETHGLVQWVSLCRTEAVGSIDGEDTHVETGTNGEVLTVTLVL